MAVGSSSPLGLARMKRNSGWRRLENWHWRAQTCFVRYGVRTAVRVTEPAALVPLKLRLPPGARETNDAPTEPEYSLVVGNEKAPPGLERLHLLFRRGVLISAAYNLEPVLGALESDLDRAVGLRAAPDWVFLRAGVVGWRGQAIVLAGCTQSETSVMVAALLRAGASYYSDRYAVLDNRGRVHPYASPLWLSAGVLANPVRYLPEDLGARTGVRALPVRTLLLPHYRTGVQPRLFPLKRSLATAELMNAAVGARQHPQVVRSAISRALARAWILEGACDETESTLNLLLGPHYRHRLKVRRKHLLRPSRR